MVSVNTKAKEPLMPHEEYTPPEIPNMNHQEYCRFKEEVIDLSKMLFARFEIMKFRSTPENDAIKAIDYAEALCVELLNRGYLTEAVEGTE